MSKMSLDSLLIFCYCLGSSCNIGWRLQPKSAFWQLQYWLHEDCSQSLACDGCNIGCMTAANVCLVDKLSEDESFLPTDWCHRLCIPLWSSGPPQTLGGWPCSTRSCRVWTSRGLWRSEPAHNCDNSIQFNSIAFISFHTGQYNFNCLSHHHL